MSAAVAFADAGDDEPRRYRPRPGAVRLTSYAIESRREVWALPHRGDPKPLLRWLGRLAELDAADVPIVDFGHDGGDDVFIETRLLRNVIAPGDVLVRGRCSVYKLAGSMFDDLYEPVP